MKLFRKLIKFLFIIILIGASICCIIGYSTYNQAVKEKPLLSRIEEITNKENYTKIPGRMTRKSQILHLAANCAFSV